MEEYLKQILKYLPLQFKEEETNEFIKYLGEAYTENVEREKYQFAFTAFHMLNMVFIYKVKWFLKELGNQEIIDSLNNQRNMSFGNLFDLSQINEKTSLEKLLKSLSFHVNDIGICKNHVEVRNNCSHASGRIYYKTQAKIEYYIQEELEFVEKIQSKLTNDLKNLLQNFLDENWQQTFILGNIKTVFTDNYFSLKDLEQIGEITLPIFKKKSNSEKVIKQKINYLLFIFEVQKQIESEINLFLEKLPIFMVDLPEYISVKKDGDNTDIYINELIEEFLIPVVSTFSSKDRTEAERILNLVE